jgi:hypothetical protein
VLAPKERFEVAAAAENTDDGNESRDHIEGNDGLLLEVGDTQARTNVVAGGAAMRKSAQAFAVADDGLG